MASEPTNGGTVSVGLPEDLDAWLDERAEELGLEREGLFQRLLTSYQVAATAGEEGFGQQGDTESLEERLDRLERDYEEGLEDVRKRVLQLKRVTDEKADADHDHEVLDRIETLDEQMSTLVDQVETLSERTERLAARDPAAGESVSREEFQDVQGKLLRVARAVVTLKNDVEQAASERRETSTSDADPTGAATQTQATRPEPAVDGDEVQRLLDIKRTAAREGYETATCDACDEVAHLSLLPEPACPACGTPVSEIVERGGLRKKPTLVGRGGAAE